METRKEETPEERYLAIVEHKVAMIAAQARKDRSRAPRAPEAIIQAALRYGIMIKEGKII